MPHNKGQQPTINTLRGMSAGSTGRGMKH